MKIFSFEKSVGAVVRRKDADGIKYLLLKYRNNHWSFPKGHVENADTGPEDTLRRELKEETGIAEYKIIDGFSEESRYFYVAKGQEKKYRQEKGRGIVIFKKVSFYLIETEESAVSLSIEHKDSAWISFSEALGKVTYENDKRILKKSNEIRFRA